MDLTENKVAEFATEDLLQRAEAIRDAVKSKSVTAEMVGSLFYELVTACGNVRDALALFLETNLTEILDGISDCVAEISNEEIDELLEDFDFIDFEELTAEDVAGIFGGSSAPTEVAEGEEITAEEIAALFD